MFKTIKFIRRSFCGPERSSNNDVALWFHLTFKYKLIKSEVKSVNKRYNIVVLYKFLSV